MTVELEDRYIMLPAHSWWKKSFWSTAQPLSDGFAYASDSNDQWLTHEALQQMIDEV